MAYVQSMAGHNPVLISISDEKNCKCEDLDNRQPTVTTGFK